MIIWIASYPRSGNSLTRQILRQCFGQPSHALNAPSAPEEYEHILGNRGYAGSPDALLAKGRVDAGPMFIKTHLPCDVLDTEKVIYLVRDARAAMVSYRRFQREVNARDFPLEAFIAGQPPLESWGAHVAWALARPSNLTLMLRYEDLSRVSSNTLARISEFIGLPLLAAQIAPFDAIRRLRPHLTRVGSNDSAVEELETTCSDIFWQTHGEMMRRLGYA